MIHTLRRIAFTFVLGCMACVPSRAFGAPAQDSLPGLWCAALHLGPAVRGELRVVRSGATGRATIAGHEVTFPIARDSVRFALANGLGRFRGAWSAGRRTIEGFWVQSPGDPIGPEQPFASGLTLEPAGKDTWRGVVVPLEETFTLYLRIDRGADGSLIGAFRNPEFNSHGRTSRFHVTLAGDSVWFSARPDSARPEIRLAAAFSRAPGRIRIFWPDLGRAIDLTRPDAATAAAFLPRPPGKTSYVYRRPPETGDGWATASPAEVGMDVAPLARIVQRLSVADPAAQRPTLVHSLLIARHGRLVLEEYFFGFDRERTHDLRSAGKTFSSVMLGAAMREGTQISTETRVYDLLASRGPFLNPDPRKQRITVGNLLTHSSGLACDDNADESPGAEMTMQLQSKQGDWWKYTLDLPMAYEPGTHYAYCSAGINLVGASLTAATGKWLPELFDRTVARPLQFGRHYWNLIPATDEGYLGGGSYLRPRDLLKIGQVYLDGGTWHGRRLVDTAWVTRSTSSQFEVSLATTGLDSAAFGQSYGAGWDAYAWHPHELRSGGRSYREYEANGNGGQLLIVVPELDLAVVFTAGLYGQGGIWQHFRNDIVPDEIIPAIRR